MRTETQRAAKENTAAQTCPSCSAALVDGMRFCRACGYRLGEGMAEYVETVRLDQQQMPNLSGQPPGQYPLTAPGGGGAQTTVLSPASPPAQAQSLSRGRHRRKGRKWLTVFLFLLLLIPVVGVGARLLFRAVRDAARASASRFQGPPEQPRSFFGASEFGDADGRGALLAGAMPGSPAERARLVDGDIITKFDGRVVNGEDAVRDVLRETPIGKTVEVVYLRDGETKTTQLTTISNEDYDSDAFTPKERGMLGIEDTERVAVAGTNIHGVRLDDVYANRPADLAGIKEGDVVVEFDGKPVRTTEGLFGYINAAKPASVVNIVVYREGQRMTIPVKMGRRT